MAPRIIECEQGTPEWFAARLGIPTASEFSTVMAKGKDGGKSLTRKTYMLKLAGEILTGEPMESYSNAHMDRGKEQEAEAREAYELMKDLDCQQVGFIRNGDKGCSPDSLIGDDGGLEIKTALPHIQVERLLKGVAVRAPRPGAGRYVGGRAQVARLCFLLPSPSVADRARRARRRLYRHACRRREGVQRGTRDGRQHDPPVEWRLWRHAQEAAEAA